MKNNKRKKQSVTVFSVAVMMLLIGTIAVNALTVGTINENDDDNLIQTLSRNKDVVLYGWTNRLKADSGWVRADLGPSGKGARCDKLLDLSGQSNIYYKFELTDWDITGSISNVKIGVYFDAIAALWNGGPDLYVSSTDGNYKRVKQSMGKDKLAWREYTTDENGKDLTEYVNSNGEIYIYVLNAAGCHTLVEKVKVSWRIANYIPNAYIDSISPEDPTRNELVTLSGRGTDPDGDSITGYSWKVGNNEVGTTKSCTARLAAGTHTISLRVKDSNDHWSQPAIENVTVSQNEPPVMVSIGGPPKGKVRHEHTFTFRATDRNNDKVRYEIDWGDGNKHLTGWFDPNTDASVSHKYMITKTYTITARAIDQKDATSELSIEKTFRATSPLSSNTLSYKLIEGHFPALLKLFELFGLSRLYL